MSRRINDIKNYFFNTAATTPTARTRASGDQRTKNLAYSISPVQFTRIRHDIGMWRAAVIEAEQAYYPHRVKMQRVFQDTILNEHVESCIKRRKNLTLLRKFRIVDAAGNEDENLTNLLKKPWFENFQSYAIDAKLSGYNLISLGDAINDAFPNLTIIPRQNVSPDRLVVSSIPYMLSGEKFTEAPFSDWHIWVATPTETGAGKCGYGLLYKIAKAEIYLRNNMAHNADYNEVFGQPLRKGKTTKTDEDERAKFEAALRNMGSMPYILLDEGLDEVELVETRNSGTTYNTYADFEKRNEQKISKVLLGHADAMDSVPGKLGAGTGADSPVAQALEDVQSEDGSFLENLANSELLPRMRSIGFMIPLDYRFEYVNDQEAEDFRRREDESNKTTADLFKTIKDAGGKPDWKYFTERTGIPVEEAPEPVVVPPVAPEPGKPEGPKL
jgi:hypothetical protein